MTNNLDVNEVKMGLAVDVPDAWRERDEAIVAFVVQASIGLEEHLMNVLQHALPDVVGMDQRTATAMRWAQRLTEIGAAFGISIRPTRIEPDPQK